MRIKITRENYEGSVEIDESRFEKFERKGWTKVEAEKEIPEEAVVEADSEELKQS